MKLALLGKGKTGGRILDLLKEDTNARIGVFDTKNPPLFSSLKEYQVILSFLPGNAFHSLIPMLLETKIPVVTASTGFTWPSDINDTLLKINTPWIYGANFAMGMQLAFHLIEKLASAKIQQGEFTIDETHHKAKLDAPSGTALHWQKLLGEKGKNIKIRSNRLGDTVGIHQLMLNSPNERLVLTHVAQDRKVFAEGALYACKKVTSLSSGLHSFYDLCFKEALK